MEKLVEQSPQQWLERLVRDKHISVKDRADHELRCLCDELEEAACFDQFNLGALACLEVAARRLNLMVDAHKQGDRRLLRLMRSLPQIFVPTCRGEHETTGQ